MRKQLFTVVCIIILIATAVQVNSCKKSDGGSATTALTFKVPAGFPAPQYNFKDNQVTQEGFELGRKLFYDGILSKDGNFPCASCHQQFAAFITYDHDLSHGFNNQFTTRNASGLFNLAWQKEFMWDGGINNLEVQPLAPITAPNEMAEDINNVVSKLNANATYKSMFKAAFGNEEINSQRMLKALTQFMVMLVSAEAKYDSVKRGAASFTAKEQSGYATFKDKCASCHAEPMFTDYSYRNNGLIFYSGLNDIGRMHITGRKEDSLKFRVPTLRNIIVTYPYMHDGRFYTIEQVFNHYATGIVNSSTLDPLLANKIALTTTERDNLKAFLNTLTDYKLINNKDFSQPQ